MAKNLDGDVGNNLPVKGAPVIRRVEVAEEDVGARVLNRHVPAWVISGAIHVVVIGFFVLFMSGPTEAEAKDNDRIITQVDEPQEDDANLINPEIGFDPDRTAATDAKVEAAVNVEAPAADGPIGMEKQPNDTALQTVCPGLTGGIDTGVPNPVAPNGDMAAGAGGFSSFTVPGMRGRIGATRDALRKSGGGTEASEAAVALGLAWLARKQLKDGSWEFDGSSNEKVAATGMALLPFLAYGETHKFGKKYKKTVDNGLNWLMGRLSSGGSFGTNNMYAHAIATIALCESA
ncbi:MAG TPA: hypothetical protein VKE40_03420, partial [Gemmataceae bacterium]|nr:hypothetical protein [Gemmataceae bacterium]